MKIKKKLLSLLTSFMLTFSLLGAVPAATVSASEADQQVAVTQVSEDEFIGNIYSDADLGSAEYLDEATAAKVPTYDSVTSEINAASNSFVTSTGSKYGYKFLAKETKGAKRQQFYNDVYDMCVKFWNQTIDHSSQTYTSSQGTKFYVIQKINFKKYDLTLQEAVSTYSVVKHDNPSFYFLPTTVAYSGSWFNYTDLCPLVPYESEYSSKSSRKTIQNSIIAFANKMKNTIQSNYTNYYKALTFNNYLRDNIEYAKTNGSPSQEHYAHNVVGPITKKKGVCEAFAKVYQLMLNYIGVENIYVIGKGNGGGHAWSMVKFDNGKYYYVDTTWNQNTKSNRFFAKGTKAFVETAPTHVAYTPKTPNLDYLYDLPAVTSGDYNGTREKLKIGIARYYGSNRFGTAVSISKSLKKSSNYVIIASGMTYHDALVAVPLAKAYDAPLLLSTDKQLTPQTKAELKRLKAKNVIVISTNGAIGASAKKELAALKLKTTYIQGKTCYETATKVANALKTKRNKAPDTIFFATDSSFADALSASPVAAIKGAPIIYLKNNGSLDKATANYLKSVKGKVKNAYIIGGNGVISDAMMKTVATKLGLTVNKTVQRVYGKNRYETCVAVNNKFKTVLSSKEICVAKGLDFPDALSGGVFAAMKKQPLFLADGKSLSDIQKKYLKTKKAKKINIFGGTGAVSDTLVDVIAQASTY